MNLLSKLGLRRIDSEIDWLIKLRDYSEEWYNELTNPIMPILQDIELDRITLDKSQYTKCAEELLKEAHISNSGEKLENIFTEMGNRGITIKSRTKLTPLISEYIESAMFLKNIAYKFQPTTAYNAWGKFKLKKNNLTEELNKQLKIIG